MRVVTSGGQGSMVTVLTHRLSYLRQKYRNHITLLSLFYWSCTVVWCVIIVGCLMGVLVHHHDNHALVWSIVVRPWSSLSILSLATVHAFCCRVDTRAPLITQNRKYWFNYSVTSDLLFSDYWLTGQHGDNRWCVMVPHKHDHIVLMFLKCWEQNTQTTTSHSTKQLYSPSCITPHSSG